MVFHQEEWQKLVDFCKRADCLLINDSAMERILYDAYTVIHPASFPDMHERVITVGSASKEYRMIGWNVGWVVGPANIITDVAEFNNLSKIGGKCSQTYVVNLIMFCDLVPI